MANNPNLDQLWADKLQAAFSSKQMKSLRDFLKEQKAQDKEVYPPTNLTFNALNLTPFDKIKVVILGQDPYHGEGQAHGMSFSVPEGVKAPPSLKNIFNELKADLGIERTRTDLSDWAQQGVLLLNSVLTVEKKQPASHAKQGWETFTDSIISMVARERKYCVFILWGAYAQEKAKFIKAERHLVLESVHPSPFSVDKGFKGSRPFSTTNAYLVACEEKPINWGEDSDGEKPEQSNEQ